jgi:predicted MPP superfamily phosphohydrolase
MRTLLHHLTPCRGALCLAAASLLLWGFCGAPEVSQKNAAPVFRFVFCNDIHYHGTIDSSALAGVVNEWKTKVPGFEFVVLAGDLSSDGAVSQFRSVDKTFDGLQKPFYPIIGNHDIPDTGDSGKRNFVAVFGKNRGNYLMMRKNVGLLFLDLSEGARVRVSVRDTTVRWLKKLLANYPRKLPLIVFSHFPLHPDTPRFSVKNAEELLTLLDKYNILAYFSGHYHGRWFGLRNRAPFFTNIRLLPNSLDTDSNPESGYIVVDVYESRVNVAYKKFP